MADEKKSDAGSKHGGLEPRHAKAGLDARHVMVDLSLIIRVTVNPSHPHEFLKDSVRRGIMIFFPLDSSVAWLIVWDGISFYLSRFNWVIATVAAGMSVTIARR